MGMVFHYFQLYVCVYTSFIEQAKKVEWALIGVVNMYSSEWLEPTGDHQS